MLLKNDHAKELLLYIVVANPLVALISVCCQLLVRDNGPSTLFQTFADFVVSEHTSFTGVRPSGARSTDGCSKVVLILVGEGKRSTVEWHTEDQFLGRTAALQPEMHGCVLCGKSRTFFFSSRISDSR